MALARTFMVCGMSMAVSLTAANAADFYLKPTQAGPVSGTPIMAISLQAKKVYGAARGDEWIAARAKWLAKQQAKNGTNSEEGSSGSVLPNASTSSTTESPSSGESNSTNAPSAEQSAGTTEVSPSGEGSDQMSGYTPPASGSQETGGTEGAESGETGAKWVSAPTSGTEGESTSSPTTTPTTPPSTTPTTTPPSTSNPTPAPAPGQSTAPPAAGQTFNNLAALLGSGQLSGGDRVFLMDGYHGPLSINGLHFSTPVTFASVPGETAHVSSINVRDASNLVFQNLKVWATSSNAGTAALIRTYANASDIAFTDLDVRSISSAANYSQWVASDWNTNKRNGFLIEGSRNTVARNRVTGLYHGILAGGSDVLIEENIVDGFGGDGMRALGDNSVVRRNKVQNCHQWDGNHADAFQSFSRSAGGKPGTGVVKNLTVEGNKFFEWTLSVTNPLRCKLQGIGMFDGMYDGTVIRNNLIVTRAYHGISLAGPLNTVIVNNTVINADGSSPGYPWIRVSAHKNGSAPSNVTVANNMASSIKVKPNAALNIVETTNVTVTNPSAEFTSLAQRDYSLKASSSGVDAGLANLAPATDIAGDQRPKGSGPDLGAYESF